MKGWIASVAALAVGTAAWPASAATAAEPMVLKLEQFRRSVALRVEIGGRERLFQFDTGGGGQFHLAGDRQGDRL